MLRVDVHTYIGPYPFRYVPHPDPEVLVRVLAREGIARAWVGHLPSAFYRDPSHGNGALYAALAPHASVLAPVPCVRPDWPRWQDAVGAGRLLWGSDLTMETGLSKLRALDVVGLSAAESSDVRWRTAQRIFPRGSFPRLDALVNERARPRTAEARA